ncbi:MerR family transcriptional regulator [Lacrimispora sp. NSJ-141]|uniref:MerR family transcriptional regulator n=1 Tax=Lientehia hominis TaxID=2897778 RepID=A0AAP2W826_9FIRM|nr:MerR family transcriptional regulator [Lientehia hominis]MCD2491695.1 MerR family transcriptional regulator [Lientehia hominis]
MMTVKQVSSLTGISVRTLQFYDEIGLFRPTKVTAAGYRLYDDAALEVLQQILFFKELDFTLKEIKAIMENPRFDKTAAFEKQRELILIKRDRLNALLDLLDKLVKGERCMEFKDFDMNDYFRALYDFRTAHGDEITERLGSMEAFDKIISELKGNEEKITDMAVREYGSLEAFTNAMKKNFQEYLSHGPSVSQSEIPGLIEKTEELTKKLTTDLSRDTASPEVQEAVRELIFFTNECNGTMDMGENHWSFMAELYLTNPAFIETTDKKYGSGAAEFIGRAIQACLKKTRL